MTYARVRQLLMLVWVGCTLSTVAQTKLDAGSFLDSIQKQPRVLIDVRSPEEFQKGTLAYAKNSDWNDRPDFEAYAQQLDVRTPVYLFCFSGGRSAKAATYLTERGFDVYELDGGMLRLPTKQPDQETLPHTTPARANGLDLAAFRKLTRAADKVLINFTAKWCAPCQKMKPFLSRLENDSANDVRVVSVDADEHAGLLTQLAIDGIPRLQLYHHGTLIWEHTGVIAETDLYEAIDTKQK